jgi:type II secretory pathway component PulM
MRAWFDNLAERERRMVLFGGIAGCIILLLAIVLPLNRNIAQAKQRVTLKQDDLSFIQAAAPQLASAGPGAANIATAENLVVIIDSSAREGGLGKSLASTQPTGEKSLRVRFDRAPFDGLMAWLARISQNYGVSVVSAEIESAGEPGMVNAGLVLKAG